MISFLINKICPNKKPPAWGGSLLSVYCFSCSSSLGQYSPRRAGRRAKEIEEIEIKIASLSIHLDLHKKIIAHEIKDVNTGQCIIYPDFSSEKRAVLTQFEFLSRFFETSERTLQCFVVNAVRDTKIARRAKAPTGHNQHIPLLQFVDKGDLILQRRLRKHVESPHWFYHRIAHINKISIQKIPLLLIIGYRDSDMLQMLH